MGQRQHEERRRVVGTLRLIEIPREEPGEKKSDSLHGLNRVNRRNKVAMDIRLLKV